MITAFNDRPEGVFIKPAEGWKRLTGFVAQPGLDRHDPRLNGYSLSRPVWCSEVLDIASEWRAYVVQDTVASLELVPDCPSALPPDPQVVSNICRALVGLRAGYVFDVAVLDSAAGGPGATVPLEVNDGFLFGAYGAVQPKVL